MNKIGIDVIIPTYNRCSMLMRCLKSIFIAMSSVTDILDVRLVVVDDGSTDKTIDMLKAYTECRPNVSILALSRVGVSKARDVAIRGANGRYIALTDSDCVVDPLWLHAIKDAIIKYDQPAAIQGRYDLAVGDDWFSSSEAGIDTLRWNGGDADCRNLILRRDIYEKIGGFATEKRFDVFAEDLLLPYKLREICGEAVIFDGDIKVSHDYPSSLWGNIRRYYSYGLTAGYIRHRHFELYSGWLDPSFKFTRIMKRLKSRKISLKEFLYQFTKLIAYTMGVIQELKWQRVPCKRGG